MTAQMRVNIDNEQPLLRKVVLFIVLLFSVYSSSANTPTQLIDKQITLYRAAYPEIEFKLLYKMADFDQLMPLTHSLGEDLSNVDYEHPDDLRITLVEAQEYRIAFQLTNGNGTATLFKTPNARITNKPYTCLITLSIPLLNEAASAATQFMYDIGDDTFKSIPESSTATIVFVPFLFFMISLYALSTLIPGIVSVTKSKCPQLFFSLVVRSEIFKGVASMFSTGVRTSPLPPTDFVLPHPVNTAANDNAKIDFKYVFVILG